MGEFKLISVHFENKKFNIGDWVTIIVNYEIKNHHDSSAWYFESVSSNYFAPCREYLGYGDRIKMTLKTYSTATIDTLPSYITLILYDSRGTKKATRSFSLTVDRFTKSLFEENMTKRNILLFGLVGSSKSTFLNSCYSLFSTTPIKQIARSGGHDIHVTTEFQGYRLVNLETKEITKIFIWDVWGLEQDNYQGVEFEAILQGKVEKKWKMATPVNIIIQPTNDDYKQHCVIFFVPVGELVNKTSNMMKKTKEFCHKAIKLDVPFVVAITKVDTVVPAFCDNPNPNMPEVAQLVRQASIFFSVGENQVFPLINYWKETEKRFELDKVIYRILNQAVNVAGDRNPK